MRAILTVGVSGSGKSSWAEKQWDSKQDYPVKVINRDFVRWMLSGKEGWNGVNCYKFDKQIEKQVTEYNEVAIQLAAALRKDIIIADTNLNSKTRNRLIQQCTELGYEVAIKEFPISFQEACRRDKERGIFTVGEAVLTKQWEQWVAYHAAKGEGMWEEQRAKE